MTVRQYHSHSILLSKLDLLGLPNPMIMWLRSYLTDRQYSVKLGPYMSNPVHASSGVPQGSNLGPLLCLLFINDATLIFPADNHLLYADDANFFRVIREPEDHARLQTSLHEFQC